MEKQEGRDAAAAPIEDPWYDALAGGWDDPDAVEDEGPAARSSVPGQRSGAGQGHESGPSAAEIYLQVQRSPAFQEVRSRYRRFVVPATLGFLLWYLAYVVAAVSAPVLMATPVTGPLNVAMVAGLAQFLTTFVLTWAYARHARLRRDRVALDLRWDTQEMTRGAER
ncbi:DUF485 domain-containing protein [Streptomyces sp. NPDC005805]|uniref:DUF485 domain-containing protein n=1 Tax=Streptomyces sp. NPDC005805 TaxID=3157068 RepID=UPI0033DA15E0